MFAEFYAEWLHYLDSFSHFMTWHALFNGMNYNYRGQYSDHTMPPVSITSLVLLPMLPPKSSLRHDPIYLIINNKNISVLLVKCEGSFAVQTECLHTR